MNQRYDVLGIGACLFAVALAAWLGLFGPNYSAKDWQPLMAALIALGAGTLAYKGAIAKVEFDREVSRRSDRRRYLSLALRMELSIAEMTTIAEATVQLLGRSLHTTRIVRKQQCELVIPGEIEEAWANLDMFPQEVVRAIALLRVDIKLYSKLLSEIPDDREWEIRAYTDHSAAATSLFVSPSVRDREIADMRRCLTTISEHGNTLRRHITDGLRSHYRS